MRVADSSAKLQRSSPEDADTHAARDPASTSEGKPPSKPGQGAGRFLSRARPLPEAQTTTCSQSVTAGRGRKATRGPSAESAETGVLVATVFASRTRSVGGI